VLVEPAAASLFAAWANFYVIIGSSAAALTGLQFVVIALGSEMRSAGTSEVSAFGTPTVVHFCAVLLIGAILSMPWQAVTSAALALGACGVAGIVYVLIVMRRTRRTTRYAPVLEDWLWHCTFPFIAYAALLAAALLLRRDPAHCLFVIAATALLLLFIGIHNAWDAVTYIALQKSDSRPDDDDRSHTP
jgi:hypothetical protein